jgi:nucleotide-binding universal stress UspA family protein
MMYSRILVGIDETRGAERALQHAATLAGALSAELHILHVVEMGWLPLGAELAVHVHAIARVRRGAGEKLLAAARERARAAGVEADTRLAETGMPAERIAVLVCSEAAKWRADLVVVGTHGRRGVERLVLGSVAEGVVRRSAVPVLLVPSPDDAAPDLSER